MPTTEHGAARSDLRVVLVSLPQVADASHELGSPSRWLHTPHGAATVAIACRDSLRGGFLLPVLVGDHVWAGTRAIASPYLRSGKSSGVAGPQAFGQHAPHGAPRDAATALCSGVHETRGALAITHLPVESGAVAPRVPRGAAPDRTGCATVLYSPGACSAPAAVEESRRQQDRLRGACARGHGVSSEEPRREERRAGAFTAGWSSGSSLGCQQRREVAGSSPASATNYLQGLQGLRAQVLDAERCSDSPPCMVAGETGGERPAASSRVAHGAVAEQSCQSALRAAGLESPAIHQSRRVGPRAGRGSQEQAGIIHAPVAQLVEHLPVKPAVAGSIPAGRAIPFREVTK